MYFWRIENLKTELASRPMTDREVLPYFVVDAVLTSIALDLGSSSFNLWDGLDLVWNIGLAVFGSIYLFRQNGGEHGNQFLQRFFAVGWVVGLRWCVWVVPLYGVLFVTEIFREEINVVELLFQVIVNTLLIGRIGVHLRDVATRVTPVEAPAQPA